MWNRRQWSPEICRDCSWPSSRVARIQDITERELTEEMCLGRTLVVGGKGDRGKVRGRKWNSSMLPNFG